MCPCRRKPEISLGEEVIATLTLLFLGGAYIIMEKFIRLYAHFLKSEKTRNESLLQVRHICLFVFLFFSFLFAFLFVVKKKFCVWMV